LLEIYFWQKSSTVPNETAPLPYTPGKLTLLLKQCIGSFRILRDQLPSPFELKMVIGIVLELKPKKLYTHM
jgi:hypothetical protein